MATVGSVELLGGRYRLGALLGRGGMADVYRADDELLGRAVAVKVFGRDAEIPDEEIRQRSEVQLLASLAHPGLVTVFDAGTDTSDEQSPRSYLVLELIDGTALGDQLSLGPLPREEVREIGCQLAAALAYVHGRGIVHRDVKPANILVSSPDAGDEVVAKLADFGIARLIDSAHITTAGTTVGTASYLSPEQVRGDDIGPASDIYSLGLVLLECLTGVRAYPGIGVETAVVRLHRPPAIPDRLGPSWVELLSAMTATDPAQRPSAAEALRALRHLTQDSSSAAVISSMTAVDVNGNDDRDGRAPTDELGPFPGLLWFDAPDSAADTHRPQHRLRHSRAPLAVLGAVLSGAALVLFGYLAFSDPASPDKAATPPVTSTSVPAGAQVPASARTAQPPAAGAGTGKPMTARPARVAPVAELRAAVKPVPKAVPKAVKPAKKRGHDGDHKDEGD